MVSLLGKLTGADNFLKRMLVCRAVQTTQNWTALVVNGKYFQATFGRALDTNDKSFLVETEDSPLRVWAQFSPVSLTVPEKNYPVYRQGQLFSNCDTLLQNL